ncbi:MAG: cobalamin B12-binding domain-containing protein [Nitrospirae bacterium]|nr:cobalamin B12-binding domain-containing protein [Nitrospirota bacterium]
MRIALINPDMDALKAVGAFSRVYCVMPPINLGYLAAVLEQEGHEVRIVEEAGERLTVPEVVEHVRAFDPGLVGLGCLTQSAPHVFDLMEAVRTAVPKARRVLGNLHADYFYRDVLNSGHADIVVHGEGERTFAHLASTLERGGDPGEVAGISYREGESIRRTPARSSEADLDAFPFPAWHLFPRDRYRLFTFAEIERPGTLILGSRGCPFHCNYCSLLVMGHDRRHRSLANMADEMEHLYERYGYRQISFIDPIFPFSRKEGLDFCKILVDRGLHRKIVWTTETRVDLVNPELLEALREAGCRRLMYGFEVGTEESLDAIDKGTSIEKARRAAQWTKAAGIEIVGFFMIGCPGETPASIERTIRFAVELDVDFAKFNVFVPYPGTDIYTTFSRDNGGLPRDWVRYTSYPTPANPPVYLPPGLTAEQVIEAQRRAHRRFYLRSRMIARQILRIRTIPLRHMVYGALGLLGEN